MQRPLIGITAGHRPLKSNRTSTSLPREYAQAVELAGGLPVILPLDQPEPYYQSILSRLDGLLFSGGGDIRPERYGSTPHPLVAGVDPDRDRVELLLLNLTYRMNLPILGICRGLQLINAGLGGTLYEDICDQHLGAIKHQYSDNEGRSYRPHNVEVKPGSRLENILGSRSVPVNSLHHQGIRVLAPGLTATAHAPDGIIEGIEAEAKAFVLAVQWHPECLQDDPVMRAIFEALVEASTRGK